MSFNEIFKNKFLEQVTTIEIVDIVIALLLSIVIGTYIFYFYKKAYKGILFSKMFATALIGMTVITTFIILAVTSNVVLSLGMVGALSIVRFRSSIKEPLDIIYIFWAISEGIVIGSRQYTLAIVGTIGISIAIAIFSEFKERLNRYILVVRHEGKENNSILNKIRQNCHKMIIKSEVMYQGNEEELIIEVIIKENDRKMIEELKKEKNIKMLSLVKYNGEYIVE